MRDPPKVLPDDHPLEIMGNRMLCTDDADMCFSDQTTEGKNQNLVFVWGLLVPQGNPTTSFFGEIQKFFGLTEDPWKQCDLDPRDLDCGGPIRERWKFDDFTKKCDNTAC